MKSKALFSCCFFGPVHCTCLAEVEIAAVVQQTNVCVSVVMHLCLQILEHESALLKGVV